MKISNILYYLTLVNVAHGIYFKEENITSGITFIKETNGSLSYQKWNIIYYYSITSYLDQINSFENIIQEIHKACYLLNDKSGICTTLIVRLENYNGKIEHSKDIIRRFRTDGRYKRSIMPMGGYILSAIFGLMDESMAMAYNEAINQLEENMKTNDDLRKTQLSVFKDSLISNDNRFKELTNKLISLNLQIKKSNHTMSNNTAHAINKENFDYLIQTATLIMIDHNRVSDTIIQLLTDSSLYKFTELLPVGKLQENLREIEYALDADKQLPINIDSENIYEIFKVAKIKTTIINNRLLIVFTIPIINTIKYDVFRTLPIPTYVNDEAVIIHPYSEYFLINIHESHFIPIKPEEYANCARKSNNQVICTPSSPIYIGKHTRCEVSLFNKADLNDLNTHCKHNIRKIQKRNYFIKLGTPNLFYVFIYKPIVVRFLCDGREPKEILIDRNGMLALDDKCVMYSEGIIVEASYESGFESKYLLESPQFDVSDLASIQYMVSPGNNDSKEQDDTGKDVTLLENFNVEFDELQKRVEQIQEVERRIVYGQRKYGLPTIDVGSWSDFSWFKLIYISIILILIIALITKVVAICQCIFRNKP